MRLGCTGCLGTAIGMGLVGVGLVLTVALGLRLLALPEPDAPVTSAADGARAQQKLFGLARHDRRVATVTLTEAELNALLDRHVVEAGGTRLSGLVARLPGEDRVDVRARTTVAKALNEAGLESAAAALPGRWQARPVQLRVIGRVTVSDGSPRQLRMDVDAFYVGTQPLPTAVLRLLVDPAATALLRWRLPEHVERVTIEPGRVVVRTQP